MSTDQLKNSNISHFIGIDYGQSKVGLAMADSETRMAFYHGTLKNDKNFLQKLAEIIEREDVSKVIIGISSDSAVNLGTKSLSRGSVPKKLINFIKNKIKIDIEYQNEMFTTLEAQRNLIEKGVKKIKKFDDQEAARLILQGWLDNSRNM